MYWNTLSLPRSYFINVINRNMRCIEILLKQIAIGSPLRINRNMRCIEIWPNIPSVHAWNWLIETWDVLKLKFVVHGQPARNRLIETWDVLKFFCGSPCASRYSINRNMRCIEMVQNYTGVTITGEINRDMRCIEIFLLAQVQEIGSRINRNMRCIEINLQKYPKTHLPRLIETWDVLK